MKQLSFFLKMMFVFFLLSQGKLLFSMPVVCMNDSSSMNMAGNAITNMDSSLFVRMCEDSLPPCAIHVIHDTVCPGDMARLHARAELEPPYTLYWFADCALTHLLKTEIIPDSATWSYYDTGGIVRRTFLFTTVEAGVCPYVEDLCADTMDVWDSAAMFHGVAVAEVMNCASGFLYDEVCQSQTASYDDPYGVVPSFASAEELDNALRHAGTYVFTQQFMAEDGQFFDSTFTLTVIPPPHSDTTVTISSLDAYNFFWHGKPYWESGHYAYLTTQPDGCDSLDILHLTVLDVDISQGEICKGESIVLEISASEPSDFFWDEIIPTTIHVGDVIGVDGAVLPPDDFFESGQMPKGVVFYVDETGLHGLAVALTSSFSQFANQQVSYPSVPLATSYSDAVLDMNGLSNTKRLKQQSGMIGDQDFASNATAAYHCYYYNHWTFATGDYPLGWYLPSSGECNLLYDNMFEVNNTLWLLQGYYGYVQPLQEGNYWSSTVQQSGRAWTFSTNGTLFSAEMDVEYMVRAIIAF